MFEQSLDAMLLTTPDGRIEAANPAACRLFGYSEEELVLRGRAGLVDPTDPRLSAALEERERTGRFNGELTMIRRDGTRIPVDLSTALFRDGDGRAWTSMAVRDASARNEAAASAFGFLREMVARQAAERAERRARYVADTVAVLSASLDYREALQRLAALLVPELAECCLIDIVEEDGEVYRVAAHAEPCMAALAQRIARFPADVQQEGHVVGRVIRTGETLLLRHIGSSLEDSARGPEHLAIMEEMAPRSAVIAPLRSRGMTIGAITLASGSSGRIFDEADRTLVTELADRAGLAIDNARLFTAEQRARLAAEREADRSRRMEDLTAALNEALTPEQVAAVCVEHGMEALGADTGALGLLVEENSAIETVHSRGFPGDLQARWARFPVSRGRPLSDAILAGEPLLIGSEEEWEARYPRSHAEMRDARVSAYAAVPITAGSRTLAGLSFAYREPREFDESDRVFLATLGKQAAQALERARLYDAERRARGAAERLQVLTAELGKSLSTGEVARTALEYGVAALGADAGVLALILPAGEELEIVGSIGYPPEACMGPGRRWPASATIPIAEATRTGESVILGSPQEWADRYLGGYAPPQQRSASRAWTAIPVQLEHRTAGALLWTYNAPRKFDVVETRLMETVARLCSQALERARLLEAERQARAAAEEANRAKMDFLSAMSHELRTPLNAIAGYVDLLVAGVRGDVSEVQRGDLRRIKRAQEVLLGLIDDVLHFARIEAGRMQILPRPVPVSSLLEDLDTMIDPQVRAKGLSLYFPPPPADLTLRADPERVRQIILNLLSNAVKFTDPGGRIDLEAEGDAERVRIHVRDSGRGIPLDKLEAIFDPFVQLDRHRSSESQDGVGLGLAISRELAQAMGGELVAKSRVGDGSEFVLALPRWYAPS